jgi:hypothetical protein
MSVLYLSRYCELAFGSDVKQTYVHIVNIVGIKGWEMNQTEKKWKKLIRRKYDYLCKVDHTVF